VCVWVCVCIKNNIFLFLDVVIKNNLKGMMLRCKEGSIKKKTANEQHQALQLQLDLAAK
jgi:hypothetical protein